MPSAKEIKARMGMGMSVAIRRRGLWAIAAELGFEVKDSDSKFGVGVEHTIAAELRDQGFSVMEQASHRAPFDLAVGAARVDVKAAHYAEYLHPNGQTWSRGYFFALNKVPATCDLYLLVCEGGIFDGDRYYVPANEAPQRMATITPTGHRFAPYRNAVHILRGMAA